SKAGARGYNINCVLNSTTEAQTTERDTVIEVLQNSSTSNRFTTKVLGNDSTIRQITELAQNSETEIKTISESSLEMWISIIPFVILMIPAFFLMFSIFQQSGGGGGRNVMNFGKTK